VVAALLLLAGCGGGSSEPQTSTDTSSAQAAGNAAGGSTSASDSPSGQDAAEAAGQAGESNPAPSASTGGAPGTPNTSAPGVPAGQGQKHGPRIAAPKGPIEQTPSAKQVAEATVADMSLKSPAIVAADGHLGRLDATYTCDGKDSWPQLAWGGVPPGTAELALFAMNVQPVEEKLFVDWAVTGLDPSLEGLEAGKLPKGAVVGTNGFGKAGYSLCPPGAGETYMFAVYALPQRLSLKRGFDALAARQAVLDVSGNVGLLPAVYERG
jgi:phosphatidylethanolamine-binding protein (PEBP) family uncharacterized protein